MILSNIGRWNLLSNYYDKSFEYIVILIYLLDSYEVIYNQTYHQS